MTDKIKIVYRKVSDLIPAEYNPRKTNDKQDSEIEASLKRFGFADPVIVNINPERKNIIVGGHQRTRIAKDKLGYKEVPCVEMNLTRDQEKELNIRLNKNTGEFDVDLLGEYFTSEELGEWGFDDLELEDIEFDGYESFGVDEIEDPDLKEGDKDPFQQMTFTLHDEQAKKLKEALEKAKETGCDSELNDNSNGNAIYHVAMGFLNGQG